MGGNHVHSNPELLLTDEQRTLLIVVHYAAIPCVTFGIYTFMKKFHIIEQRIWSPFLLMVTLTWLLLSTAFEISNHYYVDDWQLYNPQSDLINGSFSFFNFGAQNLLALSVRKKNVGPFFRNGGRSILNWLAIIWDPIMAALIVVNPIVYGTVGRSVSVTALSPLAAIAGLFTLFRVWFNLGPNNYTKYGAILFFVSVMCGVVMLAVYNAAQYEWIHALIGGSFIFSTIPLAVAFWKAELLPEQREEENAEEPTSEDEDVEELIDNSEKV